jgi:hypothetical protein
MKANFSTRFLLLHEPRIECVIIIHCATLLLSVSLSLACFLSSIFSRQQQVLLS